MFNIARNGRNVKKNLLTFQKASQNPRLACRRECRSVKGVPVETLYSSERMIFPLVVFGRASRNTMSRGYL